MHTLEHLAEGCCDSKVGARAEANAIPWESLFALVVKVVTMIIESCPSSDAKVVEILRKPTRMQRARAKSAAHDSCKCCSPTDTWRNKSGEVCDCIEDCLKKCSDAELLGIVFTTRNDNWVVA